MSNINIFLLKENKELLEYQSYTEEKVYDEYCDHVATLAANLGNEDLIKKIINQYEDKNVMLDNTAIMDFCQDKDYYNNLVYTILKRGITIPRPPIGIIKCENSDIDKYDDYIATVAKYNERCITFINYAIDNNNLPFAKKILKLVKKNLIYDNLGDFSHAVEKDYDVYSAYDALQVKEDFTDINEAKKIVAEAGK